MFGNPTNSKVLQLKEIEAHRLKDLEEKIERAKSISSMADEIVEETKKKLEALGILLHSETGVETEYFSETISNYFKDLKGDTFGYIVSSLEDEQ